MTTIDAKRLFRRGWRVGGGEYQCNEEETT